MVTTPGDTSGHLDPLEIAENAEGLLESARASVVDGHLASCAYCQGVAASISGVTATLAAEPSDLPIPDGVAARIDAALSAEAPITSGTAAADRRASGRYQASGEGFWAWLRRPLPALAGAAASLALLALIGYGVTNPGGDTAFDAGADTAESMDESADDSGGDAAAEDEGAEEAEEDAAAAAPQEEADSDLETGDGAAAEEESADESISGDRAAGQEAYDALSADEQDALRAELQDTVDAGSFPPGSEECGIVLAEEIGAELLGAAESDVVEPGTILVATELGEQGITGWLLPACDSPPEEALFRFPE